MDPLERPLSRRALLTVLGGGTLLAWAGPGSASPPGKPLPLTPAEAAGPFFVDDRLHRSDLTTNTTDPFVLEGCPLALRLAVARLVRGVARPLPGASVDVWQADAEGAYSDENDPSVQPQNTLGQTFLRGYQTTDENGVVNFKTIYPGWYAGRTNHVHVTVRLFSSDGGVARAFTTQLYFDDALNEAVTALPRYNTRGRRPVRNAADSLYDPRLQFSVRKASEGYQAHFAIVLAT
jgi:protocatechuate 3,4-dioxygenase beta subunit